MIVKHAQDVEAQVVKAGKKTTIQVLISSEEGPNFAMRRFVMESGGGMPNHTNSVERKQYVLRGHASIGIGDQTYDVRAGDVIFIPQGVQHWTQNVGEQNFEFLCIIPNKEDRITLLDKASC
jgi:quercetin dioxygenase-like cupin family protein